MDTALSPILRIGLGFVLGATLGLALIAAIVVV